MRTLLVPAVLVLALGAVACGQDTTAPDADARTTADALSYDGPLTTSDYYRAEAAHPGRPGSIVIHLFRRALFEYARTNGDSAALALAEPVRALLDSARVTWQAGDSAGAAALVEQAYLAAAGVVIDLEGDEPLTRLTALVDSGLVRLDSAIARGEAAGRDVARLVALRGFVTTLHAEAAAARAAGDLPRALVVESIAAQSLGRAMHRGHGPGGEPHGDHRPHGFDGARDSREARDGARTG